MAIVVAFVSQKGGVGKSTLARALATSAVRAGLAVKTVDLDPEQATITVWAQTRDRYKVSPPIKVDAFRFVKEALASTGGEEFVIIDTPGGISDAVAEIAAHTCDHEHLAGVCILQPCVIEPRPPGRLPS